MKVGWLVDWWLLLLLLLLFVFTSDPVNNHQTMPHSHFHRQSTTTTNFHLPSLKFSYELGLIISKMVMIFSETPCSEKYLRSLSSRRVLWWFDEPRMVGSVWELGYWLGCIRLFRSGRVSKSYLKAKRT